MTARGRRSVSKDPPQIWWTAARLDLSSGREHMQNASGMSRKGVLTKRVITEQCPRHAGVRGLETGPSGGPLGARSPERGRTKTLRRRGPGVGPLGALSPAHTHHFT